MSVNATEQVIGILQADPSIAMDFVTELTEDFGGYGVSPVPADDWSMIHPEQLGEAMLFAVSDFANAWPEFSGVDLTVVDWSAVGSYVASLVPVPVP